MIAELYEAIIKLFKSKHQPVQLDSAPDEPLQHIRSGASTPLRSLSPSPAAPSPRPATPVRPPKSAASNSHKSISFDLNIARMSIIVEIISVLSLAMTKSGLVYTALSVVGCFGSGHAPAAQSVALALYAQRGGVESGKLLGALGVMQILTYALLPHARRLGTHAT